jgi:hypothetical protein
MIKYLEHNRCWLLGARQCRGLIVYECDDGTIIPVRGMLERGAEVLAGVHLAHGITTTQDAATGKMKHLADSQQQLSSALSSDSTLNAFLTFKTDGSLLNVTWFIHNENVPHSIELYSSIHDVIENHGDAFAKVFLTFEKKFGKLIVLSSQATLLMPVAMQDYTVHAIMASIGFSEDEIAQKVDQMTPAQALEAYCEPFFASVDKMCNLCPLAEIDYSVNYLFESVVAYRTTAWKTMHTELAISYPTSVVKFLGTAICSETSLTFKPHFVTHYNTDFKEPMWWFVDKSSQINAMMERIDAVLNGEIDIQQFFEEFPPVNSLPTNQYSFTDFDCEGFVIYTSRQDGTLEYNKIKTNSYYSAHKFRPENIGTLVALAKTAGQWFPLAQNVCDFYCTAEQKFLCALSTVNKDLDLSEKSELFKKLPEKAQSSFDKQAPETRRKMLINASNGFRHFCMSAFVNQFIEFVYCPSHDDVIFSTLKSLIMRFPIADENIVKTAFVNIGTDQNLKELLGYCLDSTGSVHKEFFEQSHNTDDTEN